MPSAQVASRYHVDFGAVLGSGLFAMVLQATELATGDMYALKVGAYRSTGRST